MLKNDRVNFILALLIAIGLWTYVMVEVNPSKTSTIKDVPITFLHGETLEDEGLALLSVSENEVDVTVKGKVSDIKKVKKNDIKIYADLEGYKAGEHTIRLQVGRIDDVEIECKQKITITVEELVTEEKPVEVTITGELSDDQEPYIVQSSPQTVKVTGAKTLVNSIVKVNAPLDAEKVGSELKAFTVNLKPVNRLGETVHDVKLSADSVSVSAVNLSKKTVKLNVPLIGENIPNLEREITVPKTITVKGMDSDLDGISSITAEAVNLSEVYKDMFIPVVPIIPEGVEIAANSQNLQIQVSVKGMGTRTFEYSKDAIVVEGVQEDTVVSLEDLKIQLNVTGKESVTERLNAEDFTFYVNVRNLRPGTHDVVVHCKHEADLYQVEYAPKVITIVISSNSDGDEDGDDESADSDSDADNKHDSDSASGEHNGSGTQTDEKEEE